MVRRTTVIARVLSAAAGLAFGLLAAELTFGSLRPADAPAADAVLYSIEVRDAAGALLASPLLVGREGEPVHLALSRNEGPHSEPLQMSLDLTPETSAEGACVGYQLSIDDGAPHSGRIGVGYGERRSVRLLGPGDDLRVSFVAARAHTRAFDRILRSRRKTLG